MVKVFFSFTVFCGVEIYKLQRQRAYACESKTYKKIIVLQTDYRYFFHAIYSLPGAGYLHTFIVNTHCVCVCFLHKKRGSFRLPPGYADIAVFTSL